MQSGERFMQKVFCHQFTFRPVYHSTYALTTSHDSPFIYSHEASYNNALYNLVNIEWI